MSPVATGTMVCFKQDELASRVMETRRLSQELAAPLSAEDQTVQANPDASPTKWHLAHTTWFFETFILAKAPGYRIFDERFGYCFNSYYETLGARQPRQARGLMTRPSAGEVADYRAHVDEALERLFESGAQHEPSIAALLDIGVNHEQQHQELLLTDILSLFAANPLHPAYRLEQTPQARTPATGVRWVAFEGGVRAIGHSGAHFSFDNEGPRHDVLLQDHRLANRLVTNAEWLEFMSDGGYDAAGLWLADGWSRVRSEGWRAPLYFEERDGQWLQMGLDGLKPVDPAAPVRHVSYFEADAFARWAGKRLPTEFEWENAARDLPVAGNMLGSRAMKTLPASDASGLQQMFGDVWEWTQSAYLPYPGYRAPKGAVGEYNGKFMVSQHVLKGASCATPEGHVRATYRNFFYPWQRWQFMGLRLADDS